MTLGAVYISSQNQEKVHLHGVHKVHISKWSWKVIRVTLSQTACVIIHVNADPTYRAEKWHLLLTILSLAVHHVISFSPNVPETILCSDDHLH